MKNLILCRHAKSSWKYPTDDIYRALNKRGISDAPRLADRWQGEEPERVLCSPAVRAYSTALAYFWENQWHFEKLEIKPTLFEASLHTIHREISTLPDQIDNVWVFAHNPCLNAFVEYLAGASIDNIVTSGRVHLSLNIQRWSKIEENCASIKAYASPHNQEES